MKRLLPPKLFLLDIPFQIVGLIRDWFEYCWQPRNTFTRQGYEFIPNFLDQVQCSHYIRLAMQYLQDQSYTIKGDCYLVKRKDVKNVNTGMEQIINAQELDPGLTNLFHSGVIEKLFEERIGEPMRLLSIVIQVDSPDAQTKRGFHIDSVSPPVYKGFLYLNDVETLGDGPYTVIPGSHLHLVRKIFNTTWTWLQLLVTAPEKRRLADSMGDMRFFYSDQEAVPCLGPAGSLIISNQHIVHKGWHKHDRRKRFALIFFLVSERYWGGEKFQMYRDRLTENTPAPAT